MIEPEIIWREPLFLKIEGGTFLCKSSYKDDDFIFTEVGGKLSNIYQAPRKFKSGCYQYWHIELQDNNNGNTYVICFPVNSGLFLQVILMLSTAPDLNDILFIPYTDNTPKHYSRAKHSKVRIYCKGCKLFLPDIRLPKIKLIKTNGKIRKEYTERQKAIEPIIASIFGEKKNVSTPTHKGYLNQR